jgi:hypothetical protein
MRGVAAAIDRVCRRGRGRLPDMAQLASVAGEAHGLRRRLRLQQVGGALRRNAHSGRAADDASAEGLSPVARTPALRPSSDPRGPSPRFFPIFSLTLQPACLRSILSVGLFSVPAPLFNLSGEFSGVLLFARQLVHEFALIAQGRTLFRMPPKPCIAHLERPVAIESRIAIEGIFGLRIQLVPR